MKNNRLFLSIAVLIFLGLAVTACAGRTLTASSWPGLMVTEDTAIVAYSNHVYAVNPNTGVQKWRFPGEPENGLTFFANPALTREGQLIIGDYSNTLHSVNLDTGQEEVSLGNWPFAEATNRYIASVLASETGIYAPSADGKLYALDFQANPLFEPFETQDAQWAKPATDGKLIFLPSMDHNMYALDALTGRLAWSKDLGGAIVGTPALSEDGILYVGTFANEILALEKENGEIQWRQSTDGWVWSGPALDGDRLLFGDLSGTLYALDRANGNRIWIYAADGPIAGTPLLTDDTVYITTEAGSLIALTNEGAVKWTQTVDGKLYTSPALSGEMILVAPIENDALLIAFNTNGVQSWAFMPENE